MQSEEINPCHVNQILCIPIASVEKYQNNLKRGKILSNYFIESGHQGPITMVDITITIQGSLSLHFSNVPSQSRTNSRLKGLLNCTLLCNVIICKAHSNTNHSHKYTVSISFLTPSRGSSPPDFLSTDENI